MRCEAAANGGSRNHGAPYRRARDGGKQPVRGLWEHGGRCYAQLILRDHGRPRVRRVLPLDPETDLPVTTMEDTR